MYATNIKDELNVFLVDEINEPDFSKESGVNCYVQLNSGKHTYKQKAFNKHLMHDPLNMSNTNSCIMFCFIPLKVIYFYHGLNDGFTYGLQPRPPPPPPQSSKTNFV